MDNKKDTLTNPSIIIEVLSESTETYDRGKKFESYRNIPFLKEYILVSSDRRKIELFSKESTNKWYLSETGSSNDIVISSLSISLSLDEVYSKVEL